MREIRGFGEGHAYRPAARRLKPRFSAASEHVSAPALAQGVEQAFHIVRVGTMPRGRTFVAQFGWAPHGAAAEQQPLDNLGRDFLTDQIGDGIAPSTFLGQVKRVVNDACQPSAHAAFLKTQ
jgi:hypothetical protein